MSDIRILVADDEVTIRSALSELPDLRPGLTVVGDAADGAQAVAHHLTLHRCFENSEVTAG